MTKTRQDDDVDEDNNITENYFQIKRHQLNGHMYPLDICRFRLPGVQAVQKSKFHRATPPGGGVGFGVALDTF